MDIGPPEKEIIVVPKETEAPVPVEEPAEAPERTEEEPEKVPAGE